MTGFQIPGDLALSEGGRALLCCQGPLEVAARIRARLRMFKGRWRYNPNVGIEYLDEILTKPSDAALVRFRAAVWRTLSTTRGVTSVESLQLSFDSVERMAVATYVVRVGGETISESVAFL